MKTLRTALLSCCMMVALASCAQKSKTIPIKHPADKDLSKYSVATFAAGCFWHTEAVFESVKGVAEAVSGYAGGTAKNPTYEEVCDHTTGHAESVNVYYDPAVISYETLLKVYFSSEDPTQVNGQGNDLGSQYRSIIFYRNNTEKTAAEKYIASIKVKYSRPIAAELKPLEKFWTAENYHQNYIEHNPNQGYVQGVSIPDLKKFQKQNPDLIKPGQTF